MTPDAVDGWNVICRKCGAQPVETEPPAPVLCPSCRAPSAAAYIDRDALMAAAARGLEEREAEGGHERLRLVDVAPGGCDWCETAAGVDVAPVGRCGNEHPQRRGVTCTRLPHDGGWHVTCGGRFHDVERWQDDEVVEGDGGRRLRLQHFAAELDVAAVGRGLLRPSVVAGARVAELFQAGVGTTAALAALNDGEALVRRPKVDTRLPVAVPGWFRALGGIGWEPGRWRQRFRWGEAGFAWGLAAELCQFPGSPLAILHLHLGFAVIFVRLPWLRLREGQGRALGVKIGDGQLHVSAGSRAAVWRLPWAWVTTVWSVMKRDGSWRAVRRGEVLELSEDIYRETVRWSDPGAPERVVAVVHRERREMRWLWLGRLGPRRVGYWIAARFMGEATTPAMVDGAVARTFEQLSGEDIAATMERMKSR